MSVRIRQVRVVPAAFLLIFLIGCDGGDVYWRSQVRSGDGYWIARAQTTVYSGFGTGTAETTVWIERSNRGWFEKPQRVLGLLGDGDANGLKMRWDGRQHLVLVYKGDPKHLYFQVLKTSGIDISVQNLSMDSQPGVQPTPETTR